MARTAAQWAALYETALAALAESGLQSYSIPNRGTFTKADIPKLESAYRYWSRRSAEETYGSITLVDQGRMDA